LGKAQEEALQRAIGKAIRQRRDEFGISQEELADRSGINRTYVGDVERGERNVALVNIVVFAQALDLTASELLERSGL
jgi:transcriptional regulator with XRE-family HTH domain